MFQSDYSSQLNTQQCKICLKYDYECALINVFLMTKDKYIYDYWLLGFQ